MHVVITGGAGFLGQRLAGTLLERGTVAIDGEIRELRRLRLVDVSPAKGLPDDPRLEIVTGSLTDPAVAARTIDAETDLVFHLAAIVSSAAEADFDLGVGLNFDVTRDLLERCRQLSDPPRIVFASSVAVYGGPAVKDVITDRTHLTPQTSYGSQKAAAEFFVADYARKGFVDGRSLRLPTIVVRPGAPNKAASTWASSIIREPLAGKAAVCPVDGSTRMYMLSPRRVIEALIHAADLESASVGEERTILLPGITVSVDEMVATLKKLAGPEAVGRISFEPDAGIQRIVAGWPTDFATPRAEKLGFQADPDFASIVRAHIEDERPSAAPSSD